MNHMFTNAARAEKARAALEAYRDLGITDGNLTEDAGDLICDLLHLVRREGDAGDLGSWVDLAVAMNTVEVEEDPEDRGSGLRD